MNASTDILSSQTPLPCPRCEKLFRLPEGFTEANSLACPHCQEQVSGKEIIDALVPTATIVGGLEASVSAPEVAVSTGAPEVAVSTGAPEVAVSTGAPEVAASTEVRQPRPFDEQDFVIPKPSKNATRRRRSHHPERKSSPGRSRYSKKKESNPGAEFLKIAFGGLLALPIAQLVLWWAFNADPLGLAPSTSKVASFIVPPKLRPPAVVEEDEEKQINKDMPSSQKMQDNKIPMSVTPDNNGG